MKPLNKEYLDVLLYQDRANEKPVMEGGKHFTAREYLKYIIDLPLEKFTVKLSKQIDKIYVALDTDTPLLEDEEFETLKNLIDKAGIKSKTVFDAIQKAIE